MDNLEFIKKKTGNKELLYMKVSKEDCFCLDLNEANGIMTTFSRLKQMIWLWPSGISWTLSYPEGKLACNISAGKLNASNKTYVGVTSYWSQTFKHPKIGIYQWTEDDLNNFIQIIGSYIKSVS